MLLIADMLISQISVTGHDLGQEKKMLCYHAPSQKKKKKKKMKEKGAVWKAPNFW